MLEATTVSKFALVRDKKVKAYIFLDTRWYNIDTKSFISNEWCFILVISTTLGKSVKGMSKAHFPSLHPPLYPSAPI